VLLLKEATKHALKGASVEGSFMDRRAKGGPAFLASTPCFYFAFCDITPAAGL
jgi:hypothetical protein